MEVGIGVGQVGQTGEGQHGIVRSGHERELELSLRGSGLIQLPQNAPGEGLPSDGAGRHGLVVVVSQLGPIGEVAKLIQIGIFEEVGHGIVVDFAHVQEIKDFKGVLISHILLRQGVLESIGELGVEGTRGLQI